MWNMIRFTHGYSQLTSDSRQTCRFNIWKWNIRYNLCLLAILWLMGANFLSYIERPKQIKEQIDQKQEITERRLKVLEALAWITTHLVGILTHLSV